MSRAFVKEDDLTGGTAVLPDRAISPHPNLVTRRGLRLIETRIAEFERLLAEAPDDEMRGRAGRELRYWTARLGTARLEEPVGATQSVPGEVRRLPKGELEIVAIRSSTE